MNDCKFFFFTLTQSTMKGNDRLKYILNKMKTFFFFLILLITYIYLDNSYRIIEINLSSWIIGSITK